MVLCSKVPLIDHFYSGTVSLNQRLDEQELNLKDVK
jgi:hypothetical protein